MKSDVDSSNMQTVKTIVCATSRTTADLSTQTLVTSACALRWVDFSQRRYFKQQTPARNSVTVNAYVNSVALCFKAAVI